MGGAYTAKEATVVVSGAPPGWNPLWPWPSNALPPGYALILSLMGTGPEFMAPGVAVGGIKFILADRDTYATGEPIGDIVYTAEMEGAPVDFKFSGDDDFSSRLTGEYVFVAEDEKYGDEPEFVFDVTAEDDGKIVAVTALTIPYDDDEFTSEIEITIMVGDLTAELIVEVTWDDFPESEDPPWEDYLWGIQLMCWDQSDGTSPYGDFTLTRESSFGENNNFLNSYTNAVDEFGVWHFENQHSYPWFLGLTGVLGKAELDLLSLRSNLVYDVSHLFLSTLTEGAPVTYDLTINVYTGGDLTGTETKQVIKANNDPLEDEIIWATINGATGEITIINP